MLKRRLFILILISGLFILPGFTHAVSYIKSPPLHQVINTKVKNIKSSRFVQVPLITWGGDIATILANGNSAATIEGSIFAQKSLKLKLVRADDFKSQVKAYISGETPYLRGTMGMINMAAPLLSKDPRTDPVIIYQMTWSSGGDCIVVKPGIRCAEDLRGKSIALQAYGPHVDYLARILKDAGLSMNDVKIRWTKDLTGSDDTPAEAFYNKGVDAAFVIIPDGLALTSNGTLGTGAEGSVKGAKIMLSTKTANRIIADVYAVRSDYFSSHRKDVENFVHGMMLAEQRLKELFRNKKREITAYKKMLGASADILLDSIHAAGDAEALYCDVDFVGFQGNVKFFGDKNWPRNMNCLNKDIQSAFLTIGLLDRKVVLKQAEWDYDRFRKGLTDINYVKTPRFRREGVARVVAKKQALGTLQDGELFSFEINFKPNQKVFPEDIYDKEFKKVVDLSATYGGAIITVEGHSDPHKYNKLKRNGATPIVLKRTKQAAKNLSLSRSLEVRKSIRKFAEKKNVPLDESQFTVIGHGISQPKFPNPKTKEEWLANMRVVFRIIQIEAEESVFEPLD